MTQTPAGWYDDPAGPQPGTPLLHRWWDGQRWTEHLRAAGHAVHPVAATPDGQQLAGWWHRVGAFLLDQLVKTAVSVALGWSFVRQIGGVYADFFDATMTAARNGTQPPNQLDLMGQVTGPLVGFLAVSLLVSFVYDVTFLKALQATPGKLAVGLRVRLRERPGPLPWRAVLLHWLVQNAATFLIFIPVVGALVGFFPLLDSLWPLWDDKRQALHDKAARTNVARSR